MGLWIELHVRQAKPTLGRAERKRKKLVWYFVFIWILILNLRLFFHPTCLSWVYYLWILNNSSVFVYQHNYSALLAVTQNSTFFRQNYTSFLVEKSWIVKCNVCFCWQCYQITIAEKCGAEFSNIAHNWLQNWGHRKWILKCDSWK